MQLSDTARVWYRKASTWLAGSLGTALLTYALLPTEIKEAFPDWFLFGLGAVIMFGIPAAVQIKQPKMELAAALKNAEKESDV